MDGVVIVESSKGSLSHNGISLTAAGFIKPQLSSRSVGFFEALSTSVREVQIMEEVIDMASGGKFPEGQTELPFEFELKPLSDTVC